MTQSEQPVVSRLYSIGSRVCSLACNTLSNYCMSASNAYSVGV